MPAWIIPAAIAVAQMIGQGIAQRRQKKHNEQLAATQAQANQDYQNSANAYNSPAQQMARYKAAGLNPHLIYSQGNPGNTVQLEYPNIQNSNQSGGWDSLASNFANNYMMQTQVEATKAKTQQTVTMTELNKTQDALLKKNPLLDTEGFNAIIQGLKKSAEIKAAEALMQGQKADWALGQESFNVNGVPLHGPAGALKLELELKQLEQQFNLSQQDQKIKAEIINSKQFQNAILEVQKKFMTDGQITPQHILMFIQQLFFKLF